MAIISLSLDEGILKRLDEVARRRRYRSRSEAAREALLDFVEAAEWGGDAPHASVILAIIYEKGNPRTDLAFLQHRFEEIQTMLHTHLDETNCLQLLVAEGPTGRLKELIARLRQMRGVKQIKFIRTALES